MNERETMRLALAECAAVAGEWLRRVDQAQDDLERVERLGNVIPHLLADIMTRAADALEACGPDVAAEVDAALIRMTDTDGLNWH